VVTARELHDDSERRHFRHCKGMWGAGGGRETVT